MSSPIGNVKNLSASRTEALQALVRSLGHINDDPSIGPTEQLQELSTKINELLGDGENNDLAPGARPGQLLNEEGLPIVDISEPADEGPQASSSSFHVLEQDLIPLSLLTPDERERRRRECDAMLDLLEEEERLQQLREERDAEEEREETIRNRKESAKAELDRLKAAQELQKKMGEALVRQARGSMENKQEGDAYSKPQTASSTAKKSVSFVDAPAMEVDQRHQQVLSRQHDWGDVIPGRIRAQGRVPSASTMAEAWKYPMKMHVVERAPPASSIDDVTDSDDESSSSVGHLSSHLENDSSGEESTSSNNNLSADEQVKEGFDFDTAQHLREIALEYHEKRHAMGATRSMDAFTLDDHDQQEISNSQLLLSRFQTDRMVAGYDASHEPVSTSARQTAVPTSPHKLLQKSVRLGKVKNGQLAGGESGESGTEDEAVKEVIRMLKTGNIQNAGPDFEPPPISTVTPRNSDEVELPSTGTPTIIHGTKPSRFKMVRRGITEMTVLPANNGSNDGRSQVTVSNVVERKAPRLFPSQHFSVKKPAPRPPAKISVPTIIESPSFPMIRGIFSTSPAYPAITGPPPLQQPDRPPTVDSVTLHGPGKSWGPTRESSAERCTSKFMCGRKKENN